MSDITWKDTYGDAEGLAHHLDQQEAVNAKIGHYGTATALSNAATALRGQTERIAELEAENARLTADLQGAEQRVLREFAEWCEGNGAGPRMQAMAALVRAYADEHTQSAQAEGESS